MEIAKRIDKLAEELMDDIFPLGKFLQIVQDEMLECSSKVIRVLYKMNFSRWSYKGIEKIVGKWLTLSDFKRLNHLKKNSKAAEKKTEEAENEFLKKISVKVNETVIEFNRENFSCLPDENDIEIIADEVKKKVVRLAEKDFLDDFKDTIRGKTRTWWKENKKKSISVQCVLILLPIITPILLTISLFTPLGLAEGVLGIILAPQILIIFKKMLPIITPLKNEWKEQQKDFKEQLRQVIAGEFFQKAAHWKVIKDKIPPFENEVDQALKKLNENVGSEIFS